MLGIKFYVVKTAATRALDQTPHGSSMAENYNSRLRTYFTLRVQLSNTN